MRDALEARDWAEHGPALSEALAGLFAAVGNAFRRLNAIQFDAPWQHPSRR
ncbi:MAG TPA: hypothetical protein VGF77_00595 [Allosphingosinicella sp.]|jgi:hypothetical protein